MDKKCFYCSKDITTSELQLSCQHKICYYCYSRIPITTKFLHINEISFGKTSSSFKFTCKCLLGTGHFDIEKFITKTKESIKLRTQHKCINHPDTFNEIYCEKCNIPYCSTCFRDSECRHHINAPDIRSKCINHNFNERDEYCQTCNVAVCRVCKQLDHSKHDIQEYKAESLKDIKMKSLRYKTFDNIKNSFDMIRIKALDSFKIIRNDKEKQFDRLIDKIEELKQKSLILMESKKANMMKATEMIMLTYQNAMLDAEFDFEQMYNIDKTMNIYLHDISLISNYDANLAFIDSKINVYSPSITFSFDFIFKKININEIKSTIFRNDITAMIPISKDHLALALDNEIEMYNCTNDIDLNEYKTYYHKSTINCLLLLPDNLLVSGSNDKTVKVWSLESNREIKSIEHISEITALCYIKDGKFAFADKNGGIKVVKNDYNEEMSIEGDGHEIKSLVYLCNGGIASGGVSEQICFWDYECYGEERKVYGHVKTITQLLELKDKRIASCSLDRSIILWKDYRCQKTLEGHLDGVLSIYQMKDKRLISSSKDFNCFVWNLYTFECDLLITSQQISAIIELPIQNNGKDIEKYIITASQNKCLKIWC